MNAQVTPARAKIHRAMLLSHELERSIQGWGADANLRPEATIAEDRLSWEVRMRLDEPLPPYAWALIAGDAIHNLRSALDVLVWSHAQPAMLTGPQQQALCFPVVSKPDPQIWANAKRYKLRTLRPDIVDRIEKWQPVNRTTIGGEPDPLLLLHTLDIDDKHRLPLSTEPHLDWLDGQQQVEFADDEAAERNAPPDMTIHEAPLADGALLLSGRTKDPITKLRGDLRISVRFRIQAGGSWEPVLELIKTLGIHVEQIVADIG